jgi:hypothetical protein
MRLLALLLLALPVAACGQRPGPGTQVNPGAVVPIYAEADPAWMHAQGEHPPEEPTGLFLRRDGAESLHLVYEWHPVARTALHEYQHLLLDRLSAFPAARVVVQRAFLDLCAPGFELAGTDLREIQP